MQYSSAPFRIFRCDTDTPLDPFLRKLQELADLPDGWRFGEGISPQPTALALARKIYREAALFKLMADAFPGADGSLTVVFYAGEQCVEVDIAPDGNMAVSVEGGHGFDFHEIQEIPDASLRDILKAVSLLVQQSALWHSFDSFTHENTIEIQDDSGAAASLIPVTGQVSRWSISNAFQNIPQLAASAYTSCIITSVSSTSP